MNSTALAFDVLAEYHLEGEVTEGKLFGYSCLEVDCKAFLVDFEDDLVFNLGREAKASWLADSEDRHGFDPSGKGRVMKGWLHASIAFVKEAA